jgi:hypothetical protein
LCFQFFCNLHQVRDIVSEVAHVRERVHGTRGRLGASSLGFGKGHAREQVLLDLRPRFHARELSLRERGRRVANVTAELLGSLAQLLREFLRLVMMRG